MIQTGLNIKLIVATHSHIDHVGAVKQVKEKTGAAFVMHEMAGQSRVVEGLSRVLGGIMGGSFEKTPPPDRFLKDGEMIKIGDLQFTILHVPGHSPGSIALAGHGIVFTGDSLFQPEAGPTFPAGITPN
ncbi:MAG: MBL fold metallo-hydrolase [Dehalococcoidia bacterium]|nr:MBL fold metallo-hydrolase [Dehalococcoidia bacterium]